jgi:hypothetical protein
MRGSRSFKTVKASPIALRRKSGALPSASLVYWLALSSASQCRPHPAQATIGERGAGFRSLVDTWADTTTPHARLMVTILAGLAEFERSLMLARTGEGRTRAVARGVRSGRKPKLTARQTQEALARKAAGESLTDIARSYNVSHSTISRL